VLGEGARPTKQAGARLDALVWASRPTRRHGATAIRREINRQAGKEHDMRVMLMIKGDPEPGAAPSEELLTAMGSYNDELKTAGVLLDLAGLLPSAEGRRVKFAEGNRTVSDGPFPESNELIAGY
jgi:YCII-related domain